MKTSLNGKKDRKSLKRKEEERKQNMKKKGIKE